jgi:GNAT superfamily N-acetyltransferase
MRARIHISTDRADTDLDRVWSMLRATYWSPNIRKDVVERAIANSIVANAIDQATGTQVGFARAVSDRATFAWLCDVVVDEAHRRQGIATAMVRALIDHPELQTLRRWCLATRDAHDVYAPLGFQPVDTSRWMEYKLDPARWK